MEPRDAKVDTSSEIIRGYRDLVVWQKSMELAQRIYETTGAFPREEVFGLSCQLRRASVSVPSNIAEGRSRRSTRDFLNYLSIAYGSLAEIETQITLSRRLGYVSVEQEDSFLTLCGEIGRMLNGLSGSLRERLG